MQNDIFLIFIPNEDVDINELLYEILEIGVDADIILDNKIIITGPEEKLLEVEDLLKDLGKVFKSALIE